jgi:predicted ester cyclase
VQVQLRLVDERGIMGAAENLAVHSRWTDAEDHHDLSHHRDFLDEEIEVHLPGSEPVVGIEGYRAMMEANYAGLSGFHATLDDQFATDDRVVCRWRTSGTHSGELFGMPATGKQVEFAGVSLWEFEGGKARRGWVFPDIAAIVAQLSPDSGVSTAARTVDDVMHPRPNSVQLRLQPCYSRSRAEGRVGEASR